MIKFTESCLSCLVVAVITIAPAFATEISIKTWPLPAASDYPHDAMVHSDGSIWYAARFSNTIGRFDPETEKWTEFVTDIPNSGPHGLREDAAGNIWFTAVEADPTYIGKLDPKTGVFTEYPVVIHQGSPNVALPRSAHSLSVDQDGNIWFTMIRADMVGKLVPSTGVITLGRSPVRNVSPYSVEIDSKGTPWVSLFRTNKIASLDPVTLALQLYEAPLPDIRPRRLTITKNDVIWYTDSDRGSIGRFDPKTEKWSEWLTPGGEWSRPYGMVNIGDILWYSESWMDPSRLVRFDSRTEKFQSWPVEDCFDGAYNLVKDADDNLWFTCHDTNRLGKVEILKD